MAILIKYRVIIESSEGVRSVTSESLNLPDTFITNSNGDTADIEELCLPYNLFSYPDINASTVEFYQRDSDSVYKQIGSFELTTSTTLNLSYAQIDPIPLGTFGDPLPEEGGGGVVSYERNKILASAINDPLNFDSERTYHLNIEPDDRVVGFAVNTLPISEGQFGQYPLYAFSEKTTWALEQGTDPLIAFERISPISTRRGASNNSAIVNVGRMICVVDREGIYLLAGSGIDEEMGRPVNEDIEGEIKLARYSSTNINELWLSNDGGVKVYNFGYGRWYNVNRPSIQSFFYKGADLYKVEESGNITNENNPASSLVNISFALDPVHFGYPDSLKRIYALYVRAQMANDPDAEPPVTPELTLSMEKSDISFVANKLRFRPRHRSAYSFVLQVEGMMDPQADHWIHRIDATLDMRYPTRTRSTKLS